MFKATLRVVSILLIFPGFLFGQYPTANQYISDYKNLAISEMKRTGIPASVKMAQALLESGAGTSALATKANNHFGIKCGSIWNGDTYGRRDDETMLLFIKKKSCFRKYNDAEESFIDHSEFIRRPNGPYQQLFSLNKTDYKGWAYGLKKAGYATANDYPEKLIGIIEMYQLYQLDGMSVPEVIVIAENKKPEKVDSKSTATEKNRIIVINQVNAIVAKSGETPVSISRLTGKDIDDILKYNDYLRFASQELNQNDIVYLNKKKKSFWGKQKTHTVSEGENMFTISQTYGVKLEKLYERNHLNAEKEPAIGQTIYLRGTRPENDRVITSTVKDIPVQTPLDDVILANTDEKSDISKKQMALTVSEKATKREPGKVINKSTNSYESSDKLDFVIEPDNNGKPIYQDQKYIHELKPSISGALDASNKPVSPILKNENINEEVMSNAYDKTIFKPALTDDIPAVENKLTMQQKNAINQNNILYHTVTGGDTLYNISKRYNTSVDKIRNLNQLVDNNIKLGQKLKIK